MKDGKYLMIDAAIHARRSNMNEIAKKSAERSRMISVLEKHFLSIVIGVPAIMIGYPLGYMMNYLEVPEVNYGGSALYLHFRLPNRIIDSFSDERNKYDDSVVVHELSHRLWECLEKPDEDGTWKQLMSRRIWSEGFATYCEQEYFADLYPEGTPILQLSGIYTRGKKKMQELVDRYGRDIVLQVPSRWEEFEKSLSTVAT